MRRIKGKGAEGGKIVFWGMNRVTAYLPGEIGSFGSELVFVVRPCC